MIAFGVPSSLDPYAAELFLCVRTLREEMVECTVFYVLHSCYADLGPHVDSNSI